MNAIALGFWLALSVTTSAAQDRSTSPYRHIDNPPDPTAQLAEMVELYDQICLRAFPDDKAVARAMTERGARQLSGREVRALLRNDPGSGWLLAGRTAEFKVTVEDPPFHACGVRTMTAAGFPDLAPYRRLADSFLAGRKYEKVGPMEGDVGDLHTAGAGEAWQPPQGGGEALLVFNTTPVKRIRDAGDDSVEVRFVHQIASPGAR